MTAVSAVLFADLPPFVMCQGQPASARGMNFEGLRRRGWTPERMRGIKAIHKALYRDDLTLDQARARIAEFFFRGMRRWSGDAVIPHPGPVEVQGDSPAMSPMRPRRARRCRGAGTARWA